MSVLASIRSQLAPVHREGLPFVAIFAVVSLLAFWLSPTLGWLGFVATLWCAYFFRDPARVTPLREGILVAPADGRVSRVVEAWPRFLARFPTVEALAAATPAEVVRAWLVRFTAEREGR